MNEKYSQTIQQHKGYEDQFMSYVIIIKIFILTSIPKLNKYEHFSLTWKCGSRERDTTWSGWKFK